VLNKIVQTFIVKITYTTIKSIIQTRNNNQPELTTGSDTAVTAVWLSHEPRRWWRAWMRGSSIPDSRMSRSSTDEPGQHQSTAKEVSVYVDRLSVAVKMTHVKYDSFVKPILHHTRNVYMENLHYSFPSSIIITSTLWIANNRSCTNITGKWHTQTCVNWQYNSQYNSFI